MRQEFLQRVHESNYMWRNRRRMAWLAFISIIVMAGLCLFVVDPSRLDKLETVITWFMMAMASIVGAYMGFSTYAGIASGQDAVSLAAAQDPVDQGSSETPDNPDAPTPQPSRRKARRAALSAE